MAAWICTTYLPRHLLGATAAAGIRRVEDAPEILQPVYVAVQRRRGHDPLIRRALASLRAVAERHFGGGDVDPPGPPARLDLPLLPS